MSTARRHATGRGLVVAIAAACGLATAAALWGLTDGWRAVAALILPGLGLCLALWRTWHATALAAMAVGVSWMLWSAGAFLASWFGAPPWSAAVVPVGAPVLASLLGGTSRRMRLRLGRRDLAALAFAALLAFPAEIVFRANGPQRGAVGDVYVARGWIAHDSLFFFGLVESARLHGGWPWNSPFVGGARHRYAGGLHGALAAVLPPEPATPYLVGGVLRLNAWATGLLLAHLALAAGAGAIATVLVMLLVALPNPGSLLYPSTQFFGWPACLAAIAVVLMARRALLLAPRTDPAAARLRRRARAIAVGATLLTFPLHALTSFAPLAFLAALCWRDAHRGSSPLAPLRAAAHLALPALAALLWAALHLGAIPTTLSSERDGPLPFIPHFDLPENLLSWLYPVLAMFVLAWPGRRRAGGFGAALLVLGSAGASLAVGSALRHLGRWMLLYDSIRLLQYVLVAAAIGAAVGFTRCVAAGGRRRWAAVAVVAVGYAGLALNPTPLARGASELVVGRTQRIGSVELASLAAIRAHAPADALFLANNSPWNSLRLPAFSGRATWATTPGAFWSRGSLGDVEVYRRFREASAFFENLDAAERGVFARENGITHVWLRPAAYPRFEGDLGDHFPPEEFAVVHRSGGFRVLVVRGMADEAPWDRSTTNAIEP